MNLDHMTKDELHILELNTSLEEKTYQAKAAVQTALSLDRNGFFRQADLKYAEAEQLRREAAEIRKELGI